MSRADRDSQPVRPLLVSPVLALPGTPEGDSIEIDDETDIGVDPTELALDDPIVGQKPGDERKARDLNPHAKMPRLRGPPTPKTMSEAQGLEHMVSNLPYDHGCEFCAAGKRNISPR